MTRASKVVLAATLLIAVIVVQSLAGDEKAAPEVKALLQEIKSLRLKIEQLEVRIEMLEREVSQRPRYDDPVRIEFPTNASSKLSPGEAPKVFEREDDAPSLFDWHQHEMPWLPFPPHASDKGLYVLPGLDAPPLSPMDVPIR